ncbi:hypothetical protein V7056_13600 [Bacillus sp. JJ664]
MKFQINRNVNQAGLTIVELLTTLSLLSIVLISMYGILTLGIKTYNKITVESTIRDESDYVVSRILNELYSTNYNHIELDNGDNSIAFYTFDQQMINQYDDFTSNETMNLLKPKARLKIEDEKIQFYTYINDIESVQNFHTEDSIHLNQDSSISLQCTKNESSFVNNNGKMTDFQICKSGILKLNLVFETNKKDIKPYTLKTEIGF